MAADTDEPEDAPGVDEVRPASARKPREDAAEKAIRLAKEAKSLQAALNDGLITDQKSRVAWILNLFPHTRDSDIALTLAYWENFQRDIFNPHAMSPRDLFRLERESYIVRVRAKIQNEYGLFPGDPTVRGRRRAREEEMKDATIEDKPASKIIFVFADETGKNGAFVCVAAVWVLTGAALVRINYAIASWQASSPWAGKELHFKEFKKEHVAALAGYLRIIHENREFLSFKVITMEQATTRRPADEIVRHLHEYMLIRGASHEIEANRIKLPHSVRLTVDAEQSLDSIACDEIKTRVAQQFKSKYGDDLTVEGVSALSSKKSELVQLADVIAGAFNRRKNGKGERNHKDEIADMVIDALGISVDSEDIPGVDATATLSI